jgi:transcriptional regulator with XRE-family HTH domain
VQRSGRKHAAVARDAGIAPETLSRILNASHARPGFETVARIAHASGETVGWVLDERGYVLSSEQLRRLRDAAALIESALRPRER